MTIKLQGDYNDDDNNIDGGCMHRRMDKWLKAGRDCEMDSIENRNEIRTSKANGVIFAWRIEVTNCTVLDALMQTKRMNAFS